MRSEFNAVAIWPTDAECVYSLSSFRAMNWSLKVLSLCSIFIPISATACFILRREHDPLYAWWPWFALLCWANFALDSLTFLRGHIAQVQGIKPERPNKPPSRLDTGDLVVMAIVFCFLALTSALDPQQGWTLPLIYFAGAAAQGSFYARTRFWNDGAAATTLGTPAVPDQRQNQANF